MAAPSKSFRDVLREWDDGNVTGQEAQNLLNTFVEKISKVETKKKKGLEALGRAGLKKVQKQFPKEYTNIGDDQKTVLGLAYWEKAWNEVVLGPDLLAETYSPPQKGASWRCNESEVFFFKKPPPFFFVI